MKKFLIVISLVFFSNLSAQTDFGVVAGVNYGDNGEIEFQDLSTSGEDVYSEKADSKVGYHFGLYFRAYLTESLFLKPEVLYTQTKSSYNYNNEDADYTVTKIDLPILVGFEVIGPLQIFGGPSLQYITDHEMEGVTFGEIENEFTVGVQFGAGLQFGRFGIDARYERGLSENEAEVLDLDSTVSGIQRIDTRPNQFILSLSVDF
ncbi:MAG TPA: porin family protein [Salinimicrobium sp.]|nr:porin family protein [Salinimicrobium sp.]